MAPTLGRGKRVITDRAFVFSPAVANDGPDSTLPEISSQFADSATRNGGLLRPAPEGISPIPGSPKSFDSTSVLRSGRRRSIEGTRIFNSTVNSLRHRAQSTPDSAVSRGRVATVPVLTPVTLNIPSLANTAAKGKQQQPKENEKQQEMFTVDAAAESDENEPRQTRRRRYRRSSFALSGIETCPELSPDVSDTSEFRAIEKKQPLRRRRELESLQMSSCANSPPSSPDLTRPSPGSVSVRATGGNTKAATTVDEDAVSVTSVASSVKLNKRTPSITRCKVNTTIFSPYRSKKNASVNNSKTETPAPIRSRWDTPEVNKSRATVLNKSKSINTIDKSSMTPKAQPKLALMNKSKLGIIIVDKSKRNSVDDAIDGVLNETRTWLNQGTQYSYQASDSSRDNSRISLGQSEFEANKGTQYSNQITDSSLDASRRNSSGTGSANTTTASGGKKPKRKKKLLSRTVRERLVEKTLQNWHNSFNEEYYKKQDEERARNGRKRKSIVSQYYDEYDTSESDASRVASESAAGARKPPRARVGDISKSRQVDASIQKPSVATATQTQSTQSTDTSTTMNRNRTGNLNQTAIGQFVDDYICNRTDSSLNCSNASQSSRRAVNPHLVQALNNYASKFNSSSASIASMEAEFGKPRRDRQPQADPKEANTSQDAFNSSHARTNRGIEPFPTVDHNRSSNTNVNRSNRASPTTIEGADSGNTTSGRRSNKIASTNENISKSNFNGGQLAIDASSSGIVSSNRSVNNLDIAQPDGAYVDCGNTSATAASSGSQISSADNSLNKSHSNKSRRAKNDAASGPEAASSKSEMSSASDTLLKQNTIKSPSNTELVNNSTAPLIAYSLSQSEGDSSGETGSVSTSNGEVDGDSTNSKDDTTSSATADSRHNSTQEDGVEVDEESDVSEEEDGVQDGGGISDEADSLSVEESEVGKENGETFSRADSEFVSETPEETDGAWETFEDGTSVVVPETDMPPEQPEMTASARKTPVHRKDATFTEESVKLVLKNIFHESDASLELPAGPAEPSPANLSVLNPSRTPAHSRTPVLSQTTNASKRLFTQQKSSAIVPSPLLVSSSTPGLPATGRMGPTLTVPPSSARIGDVTVPTRPMSPQSPAEADESIDVIPPPTAFRSARRRTRSGSDPPPFPANLTQNRSAAFSITDDSIRVRSPVRKRARVSTNVRQPRVPRGQDKLIEMSIMRVAGRPSTATHLTDYDVLYHQLEKTIIGFIKRKKIRGDSKEFELIFRTWEIVGDALQKKVADQFEADRCVAQTNKETKQVMAMEKQRAKLSIDLFRSQMEDESRRIRAAWAAERDEEL